MRCILRSVLLAAACIVSSGIVGHAQNYSSGGMLRVGAFLQGAFANFDIAQAPKSGAAFQQSVSPRGLGGGGVAGYDYRIGDFVVGGEVDAAFDNSRAITVKGSPDEYGVDYQATLRARLGYFLAPNVLAYGTGGVAMQATTYRYSGTTGVVSSSNGVLNNKESSMFGLSAGGGLEYNAGWGILFGEYLYNDYGSWNFNNFNGNHMNIDASGSVARLGVKFIVGYDDDQDIYPRNARRY